MKISFFYALTMFFICAIGFSQKVILHGDLIDFSVDALYYNFDKPTFLKKQKIDIFQGNYLMDFSIEKIRKYKTLYISTSQKPEKECIYEINIQELLKLSANKNIIIQNDFFSECASFDSYIDIQNLEADTLLREASDTEKMELLGADELYVDLGSMKVNFELQKVEISFPEFTKYAMHPILVGAWSYFPEKKEILILLHKSYNPSINVAKGYPELKIQLEVGFDNAKKPYFNLIEMKFIRESLNNLIREIE